MSVYVDDMEAEFGRMKMCHMWADTYPELLAMVDAIGVQRKWVQFPPKASWVHFDIALSKRALAVQCGAIPKTQREAVGWWETQRAEPSYTQFYPGFAEGYAHGSVGNLNVSSNSARYFYSGWCYAWEELGLKPPRLEAIFDDDIPF